MAKKKAKKPAKASSAKAPAPKKTAKPAPAPEVASQAVVLYELRDQAGTIRYHSDHTDVQRARFAARILANSPDVGQAWVIPGVEVVRGGT
jgi:hypothetical protein